MRRSTTMAHVPNIETLRVGLAAAIASGDQERLLALVGEIDAARDRLGLMAALARAWLNVELSAGYSLIGAPLEAEMAYFESVRRLLETVSGE
ncbi:MAG: hypothetical protein ACXVXP_06240 [Mycobacteriaceae bacterium]